MSYLKESEFDKYSGFTKDAIDGLKSEVNDIREIQESIIEQNDSIVDEYNNAEFKTRLDKIDEKLDAIDNWADHVKEEFDTISTGSLDESTSHPNSLQEKYNDLEAKFEAMVKWTEHVTETVSALEDWSDHSTDTVSAIEKFADHVTESVTGIEKWSDHVTESVTGIEKFADHVTESVTNIENWSDHVTESVTNLENNVLNENTKGAKKINESNVSDFKASIYNKLESILEAKEQGATDHESLNESKEEKLNENESPLWLKMIPSKYNETWNTLEESEKARITKRANLFEFKTESAIKDFWNNEFTKENLIKEEKSELSVDERQAQLNERRMNAVKGYNRLFG